MTKLNDSQRVLLASAAQRDNGSLLPLSDTLATAGERVAKAIAALTKSGFAEERETSDPAAIHRLDGDLRYGIFATAAGLAAIGIGDSDMPPPAPTATLGRTSKTATVIALLERDCGATLAELIETTSWLPHTTRAALTGLRKKGHAIERAKRSDETCYRIVKAA